MIQWMAFGGFGLRLGLGIALVLTTACSMPALVEDAHAVTPTTDCESRVAVATPPAGANALVGLLDTGRQAFMARAALIEGARCTLDAQYYIWNSDDTGRYLLSRILAAADRGVRVRLLIDDINTAGRDQQIAALSRHANVAVRIYNPFQDRGMLRSLGFVSEFSRLNRRMHVKSFTIDGVITLLGGRNIGDEYFDTATELNFRDRDVLVSGEPAVATERMFSVFWDSSLSRPIEELVPEAATTDNTSLPALEPALIERLRRAHGELPQGFEDADRFMQRVSEQMVASTARLVHDDPPALDHLGDTDEPQPSAIALTEIAATAADEILIESAYLVMDDETLDGIKALRANGIAIRALTNSLASNDVTANHAAYAGRRKQMLEAGIDLFELRPDASTCTELVGDTAKCRDKAMIGLHAKTFVLDRRLVYVGSFNLNLRSRYLNAESGLIIENAALASRIANDIDRNMQVGNSWTLALDDGNVVWFEDPAQPEKGRWTKEPTVPWSRRMLSMFIAGLGLEKYL